MQWSTPRLQGMDGFKSNQDPTDFSMDLSGDFHKEKVRVVVQSTLCVKMEPTKALLVQCSRPCAAAAMKVE